MNRFDIYDESDDRDTSVGEAKRESNWHAMSNETTMTTMKTTTTKTLQILITYLKGGNLKKIAHATI